MQELFNTGWLPQEANSENGKSMQICYQSKADGYFEKSKNENIFGSLYTPACVAV